MNKIRYLKGLGAKSEQLLSEVGITNVEELRAIGPVGAFIRLKNESRVKPSMNFLYALVGALEDEHWLHIAKHQKGRLLMELEGYEELEQMLKS